MEEKNLISEFNEAGFQIARLNNLWVDFGTCNKNRDYHKMHFILDCIYIELSADMAMPEHDMVTKIDSEIAKFKSDIQKLQKIFRFKAIYLKQIQEKQGKSGKKGERHDRLM